MNALEAREMSDKNAKTRNEEILNQSIKRIEDEIKKAAYKGLYSTEVTIFKDSKWDEFDNERRIRDRFRNLGFVIDIYNLDDNETLFRISW